jgi:hypothetical protein
MEAPVVAAIIAGSVATVASVVTAILSQKTLNETKANNRRVIESARLQKRKDTITESLNEFYGPLQAYLQVSHALSELLKTGKPPAFRTLTYLLQPSQEYEVEDGTFRRVDLSEDDRVILAEIVAIGQKIEKLVLSKGGLVDDKELFFEYTPDPSSTDVVLTVEGIGLLSLVITHFRVIRLASEGKLKGDVEPFRQFVFPREITKRLRIKIDHLREEIRGIDAKASKIIPPSS